MACLAAKDKFEEKFLTDARQALPLLVLAPGESSGRVRRVVLEEVEDMRFVDPLGAKRELERIGRELLEEAQRVGTPLSLLEDLALTLATFGSNQRMLGKRHSAAGALALALELPLPKTSATRANLFQRAAFVLDDFELYKAAEDFLGLSDVSYSLAGDLTGLAKTLVDRGYFAGQRGDYEVARSFFERSLERLPSSEWRNRATAFQSLSRVSLNLGDEVAAQEFLEHALSTYEFREDLQKAYLSWDLGRLFERRSQFKEAETCLLQALSTLEKYGRPIDRALVTIDLYSSVAQAGQRSRLAPLRAVLFRTLACFSKADAAAEEAFGEFARTASQGAVITSLLIEETKRKLGALASASAPRWT